MWRSLDHKNVSPFYRAFVDGITGGLVWPLYQKVSFRCLYPLCALLFLFVHSFVSNNYVGNFEVYQGTSPLDLVCIQRYNSSLWV